MIFKFHFDFQALLFQKQAPIFNNIFPILPISKHLQLKQRQGKLPIANCLQNTQTLNRGNYHKAYPDIKSPHKQTLTGTI